MLECCAVLPFDDEKLPLFTVGQVAQMLEVQQAIVRYVAQLADEGMTLAAIRRVLELEDQVRALQAERDALLTALAERDEILATLTSRRRPGPALQGRRAGSPRLWIRGSTPEDGDGSRDRPDAE